MKVLSVEEAKQFPTRTNGRQTRLSMWLRTLKPGEALVLEEGDWKSKKVGRTPFHIAYQIRKTLKWKISCSTLPGGKGYVFKRIS